MTTSGSTDFTQTRDQISTDVLQLLGVYGPEDTPTSSDLAICSNFLNKMVKAWECQGVHLWTYNEAAIFLTEGFQKYSLSSSSSDITGDDPIYNSLDGDASGSSITVLSENTNFMTIGDNIGIKLDDNTLQWTTITGISGQIITLNTSLTGAASSGNNVFTFTTRTDRPLSITGARFKSSSGFERPIKFLGRDDFMKIPSKDTTGSALQAYYSPKVSTAHLYVWPTADDVGDCICISYLKRIQDFDSSSNTPDLPQEALEAITYNLAIRVAPAFGIATQKLNPDISVIAVTSLEELKLWDVEDGSVNVVSNYRYDD